MGYSNGNLSLNKAQKGEKGDKGQGLSFTAGNHYDIKNWRRDYWKQKAGTTYANKELAKKANTSSPSDYAKKNEVDNLLPKSYLYFAFEENGSLAHNRFLWAFGNGVNGAKVVPRPGKIVSATLWAVSGNNSVGEIIVQFEINGTLRSEIYHITKPAGEESVVVDHPLPIQVQRNDRIRVRSQTTNRNVSASTVCILIELDWPQVK